MQTIDIDVLAAHAEALRGDQRALRTLYIVDAPEQALEETHATRHCD